MTQTTPSPPADTKAAERAATATYDAKLSRSLGVGGNVLITLSGISPASSVFILGGAALATYGTGVFWGFAIAGVISLLIAFCYAELASRHPLAGGDYSLVSRTLGPAAGVAVFFVGLITLPLIVAVFALGVADYLGVAIAGLDPVTTAVIVAVIATATACLNIRTNAWVTGAFLVVEMAALALLTLLGLIHVERPITALFDPQAIDAATGGLAPLGIAGLVIAVTQGIFSYNGYSGAVYFAEETKNARHTVARAVLWSAVITILTEIIPLAAIMLGTNSLEGLFTAELPVEGFLDERAGHAVTVFVLVSIALAIVNAIIAIALQSGRLLFAAARPRLRAHPDAVDRHHRHGHVRRTRLLRPDRRAAQRHRIHPRVQLRLHRARGNRHAAQPNRSDRLPHAAVAAAAGHRAGGDRGHLRHRRARPRPVAEHRHRAGHHRGRLRLLLPLSASAHRNAPAADRGERGAGMTLDLLITGARVRTFDTATPWAEAVGVTAGRVAYVGDAAAAPAARERIAAAGRLVTPGIIDSHNHLLLGFDEDAVSLEGVHEIAEVRRRIGEFASRRTDLDWICAENAVYSVVEGRRPNAADLDGLTDRPIFVTTYDQHSVWLNAAALTVLGIADGADVAWGRPERDPITGQPTGWVTDFYTSAMTEAGLAQLQRDIPMYSPQRRYRKLCASMRMATALGITTVVEPQVPLAELPLFERALAEGVLTSRVIAALFHPVGADGAFRRRLRDAVDGMQPNPLLRLGPVKLYADDVIEPHTALMLEDYANRPGVRGRPSYPGRELVNVIAELDRLGFQTHTHATGDAGIRLTLDAIGHAARINGTRDRRHGIVHVECLHPDDLHRFQALGVTAAMQPRHCSPDLVGGTWMDNVGEQRWNRAWRFRSLVESGAHVALSSDWQVGEMDPLVGLYSALTRAGLDGRSSWTGAERLGLDRSLQAYTVHGARAWHAEHDRGRIAPGMLADLVVWSSDLYAHEESPDELLGHHAELTLVGGTIAHSAGALT